MRCLIHKASFVALFLWAGASVAPLAASEDFEFSDPDAPFHDYWQRPLNDPFSLILEKLESGQLPLDRSSETAFLTSLLTALDIPVSSQMLVYSTTSLQLRLISPRNPRALYFNDDIYLGYVPGGKIEIVSIDPELGAIFYIFDIPRGNEPVTVERSRRCMNCHSNEDTREVPGVVIRSVMPGPSGGSLDSYRRGQSGHQVPMTERFGGWHVTGDDGVGKHWGNLLGQFREGEIVTSALPPGERFDWGRYPVATSDVLAHLLHEHQAGFVNRVVEAHYRSRSYLAQGGGRLSRTQREEMNQMADALVRYLLFADEVPLPAGSVTGDESLKREFLASRRANSDGLSLRDLDLNDHLFRYRCSYMIYRPVFLSLPDGFKRLIYDRLARALDSQTPAPEYSYLPDHEKSAIRRILVQTHPDLGDWPAIGSR